MEHTPATTENLTERVFDAFAAFINQRPGLDPRNYFSDWRDKDGRRAYNSENRSIQKDGQRARTALKLAQAYPFNAAALIEAARSGFSGRLTIIKTAKGTAIDYCTGQYWPTEYRKAAAVVLERYVEEIRPKTVTGRIPQTVAEMKEMNRQAGFHFFDRDTIKFFRSRILSPLYVGPGGVFFVTSEKSGFDDSSPRLFTVRQFDPKTADVESVRGEGFGKHTSESDAKQNARILAINEDHPNKCDKCGTPLRASYKRCSECEDKHGYHPSED